MFPKFILQGPQDLPLEHQYPKIGLKFFLFIFVHGESKNHCAKTSRHTLRTIGSKNWYKKLKNFFFRNIHVTFNHNLYG